MYFNVCACPSNMILTSTDVFQCLCLLFQHDTDKYRCISMFVLSLPTFYWLTSRWHCDCVTWNPSLVSVTYCPDCCHTQTVNVYSRRCFINKYIWDVSRGITAPHHSLWDCVLGIRCSVFECHISLLCSQITAYLMSIYLRVCNYTPPRWYFCPVFGPSMRTLDWT